MTCTLWPSNYEYSIRQHCSRCGANRGEVGRYPPAFPYDTRTKRRSEGTLSADWAIEHGRRRRSQHRGLSCEGERPGAEAVS